MSQSEVDHIALRMQEAVNAFQPAIKEEDLQSLHLVYEMAEGRHASHVIAEHAARHLADTIVLGTHGGGKLRHLLLGSVAEAVIREAMCPVLVVRGTHVVPPSSVSHIVVAVDFSDYARAAVEQARYLAAQYGATLTLLFVAEEHIVPFFSDTGIPTFSVLKIDEDIVQRAGEALRQLNAGISGPEVPTFYEVRHGLPAFEITEFAKQHEAGLLVLATRGLHTHNREMLGSVAERVVRTAPCPVWTVNPVVTDETPGTSAERDASEKD